MRQIMSTKKILHNNHNALKGNQGILGYKEAQHLTARETECILQNNHNTEIKDLDLNKEKSELSQYM